MVLVGSFNTIKHSSYSVLIDILKQKRESYQDKKSFIDETLRIIKKNPFNEYTVDLLLKEGWACKTEGYVWSTCNLEKKLINLDRELVSQGEIYDFYERDLVLIHELNHAWYSRFRLYSNQKCLTDNACSFNEFENRIINEIISRKNRANPLILKSAVENFGLKPQIYDLASKMAFENNSHIKISPLAQKDKLLLKTKFIEGPDAHYYKIVLENSLNNTSNKFWEELFEYEDFIWKRTLDFLIDKRIVDTTPLGNYALIKKDEKKDEIVFPCLDVEKEYYIRNKKDALNYLNYLKEKEEQDLKLVKIQEVKSPKQF